MSTYKTTGTHPTNAVLDHIAAARGATSRVQKLECGIKALLTALDQQFLDGKPPGQYHYSGNVTDAMQCCRGLVRPPQGQVSPEPEDEAHTLTGSEASE